MSRTSAPPVSSTRVPNITAPGTLDQLARRGSWDPGEPACRISAELADLMPPTCNSEIQLASSPSPLPQQAHSTQPCAVQCGLSSTSMVIEAALGLKAFCVILVLSERCTGHVVDLL